MTDSSINQTLVSDIGRLARDNFSALQEDTDLKTATAKFFHYPDRENSFSIIKVFYGATAESLYIQEINALYTLRNTGRVSEVICDSNSDDVRFWEPQFSGPYFIAKPNYRLSLETVVSRATEFEKLDLAAQEVHIARELLAAGWRDWDWSIRNDVVEAGKVIRVDLDSATALTTLLKDKANINDPRYFSTAEGETIKAFLLTREKITKDSELNEVRNMAIRLSYLLLPENDHAELTDQILDIQKEISDNQTPDSRLSSDATRRLSSGSSLGRAGEKTKRLVGSALARLLRADPEHNTRSFIGLENARVQSVKSDMDKALPESYAAAPAELKKWLSLWSRRAGRDEHREDSGGQPLSRLTASEWQLVSLLLYHLIADSDHGFSLEDLYTSLLATNIVCVRQRLSQQTALSDGSQIVDSLSPNISFFELRRFLGVNDPFAKQPLPEHRPESDVGETIAERRPLQVKCSTAGDSWKATSKKLNRESEDRVFYFPYERVSVIALTDGVSEAEGLASSQIVIEEIGTWSQRMATNPAGDLSSEVRDLISNINSRLIAKRRETNYEHQATLALAVLTTDGYSCRISIAQAGDSNCVIFLPDNSIRASTLGWKTQRLGLSQTINEGDFRIEYINLDAGIGTTEYRIRLFSDGIGEPGFERVKQVSRLEDLVAEAANWGKSLGIGTDDWSVAGADIQVVQGPTISKRQTADNRLFDQQVQDPAEPRDLIAAIKSVPIKLSKPARRFWLELEDWKKKRHVVMNHEEDGSSAESEPQRDDRVDPRVRREDEITWRTASIVIGLVLIGGLIVLGVYKLYIYANSPNPEEGKIERDQSGVSQGAPTTPVLLNDRQRRIYTDLKNRGRFVQTGLPGGQGIPTELRSLLDDLAEVTRRANLRIIVEVYSTPAGPTQQNLVTSTSRATAMKSYIVANGRVLEDQVEVLGKGSWLVASSSDNELMPPAPERNNALIRVLLKR